MFDFDSYYYKIPGLLVPKTENYHRMDSAINKLIDLVPSLTESLEDNITNRRKEGIINDLEQVLPLLRAVHCRWLETDSESILRSLINIGESPIIIKRFITNLNALSIEMQRAQRSEDIKKAEAEQVVSAVEKHADTANNLSAVTTLLDDEQYESAESLVTDLDEYDDDMKLTELLNLILEKKYDEAITMTKALKEHELEAVSRHAGADLSKNILAVDDRPEILSFVSNTLKNHYKVFGVTNGNTAIKVLDAQKPDLFILDIDMPVMDGYKLAEIIRSTVDYKNTPIIFLTGNSSREHVLKAIEVGGNDFIVKPASHEALLSKAGKYLNKIE
jgi:CheY-like chemotaxis protein